MMDDSRLYNVWYVTVRSPTDLGLTRGPFFFLIAPFPLAGTNRNVTRIICEFNANYMRIFRSLRSLFFAFLGVFRPLPANTPPPRFASLLQNTISIEEYKKREAHCLPYNYSMSLIETSIHITGRTQYITDSIISP